jgi:hypothetical protein
MGECEAPDCWAADTRHYHHGGGLDPDRIAVLPGEPRSAPTVEGEVARLLREFAEYDDDLGWPGAPDVGEHADELAAFLVGNGLCFPNPPTTPTPTERESAESETP